MKTVRQRRTALVVLVCTIGIAGRSFGQPAGTNDQRAGSGATSQTRSREYEDQQTTEALFSAVAEDDRTQVRRLVKAGVDVNWANRFGYTALLIACELGNGDLIEELLNAGARTDVSLPEGQTPLMSAARAGSLAGVEALVRRKADVNAHETWRGQTALMWVAAEDHPTVAEVLIRHGADVAAHSKGGFTPLIFAARAGNLAVAKVLVEAGAPLDAVAPDGSGALVVAIINGNYELAAYLIESGADVNASTSSWGTPLHRLVRTRNEEKTSWRPTPHGNVSSYDLALLLLEYGADADTPLVRRQAKDGAFDLNYIETVGATPLWMAAKATDWQLVNLFIEYGATVDKTNREHTTPLMVASGLGFVDGQSPGADSNALQTVALLVAHGADVNAVNDNQETAMHGPAYSGWTSVVQFLADRGVRTDVRDALGRTPLDISRGVAIAVTIKTQPATEALLLKLAAQAQ